MMMAIISLPQQSRVLSEGNPTHRQISNCGDIGESKSSQEFQENHSLEEELVLANYGTM